MKDYITGIEYKKVCTETECYLSPVVSIIEIEDIDKIVQYKYDKNSEESLLEQERIFKENYNTYSTEDSLALCLTKDGKKYRVDKEFIDKDILDKYLVVVKV